MLAAATGGALAAVLLLTAADAVSAPRDAPPGEGVICLWAMVVVTDQVGSRCFAGENAAFQAEAKRSVERIDAYVMANSRGTTREVVAQFKREQGGVGAPDEKICRGEPVALYRAFETNGTERLRAEVDKALARPGDPTWGDCL